MVKAIFLDIDGTLVSFETGSIPESAKKAINLLHRKGIKIFIATGRAISDIPNLDGLIIDGIISSNGACNINSKGEIVSQSYISKESMNRLAIYLEEKPFPCEFATNEGTFLNFANDEVLLLSKLIHVPVPPMKTVAQILAYDILQLGAFVDSSTEKKLLNEVLTDCESSRWNPLFADINVKNCNKASGIDRLLSYYDIERAFTMAFGDGENDISMLKHVAIGVAMGNASDEVKKAADYVTSSVDEDGILNALQYFKII